MSVQIFLEGKLLGIDEFLLAPAGENPDQVFLGRSHWISLLSEESDLHPRLIRIALDYAAEQSDEVLRRIARNHAMAEHSQTMARQREALLR